MIRARHLAMAGRFLTHRFRAVHPYEVQALLLNACNLKCVYCRCPDIKTALLSTAQWLELIRNLASVGTMRIKFQGGEPTLRNDFRELSAEAHALGLTTAVITNGLEVAAQPALLDHLDEMVASLDAVTPEIHDRLRGQGTHPQVVRAIDVARARGLRVFVVMVASRPNLCEVEAMLEFCEARGVGLHVQPMVFGRPPFDDQARHLALGTDDIRALHHRLADWKRQGRRLMFSAATYEHAARWPDYTVLTTPSPGDSRCMAAKFYIHIEANGDVWPCHQHGAQFIPKNIIRDGFEATLRHVQHHNCGDCFTTYLNERKAVFGLRPSALYEMIRRG